MNILLIQTTVKLTQPIAWQTAAWNAGTSKISFATCNSVSVTFYVREQRFIPRFSTFHVVPWLPAVSVLFLFYLAETLLRFQIPPYIETGRLSEISKHTTRGKIILHSEWNFAYTHYIQCLYYFASIHCFSSLCCENLLMWNKKTRMKTTENSPLVQYWECVRLTAKEKRDKGIFEQTTLLAFPKYLHNLIGKHSTPLKESVGLLSVCYWTIQVTQDSIGDKN